MSNPITLTITERAIIANQFRILAELDNNDAEDYIHRAEALERGFEVFYGEAIGMRDETIPYEIGQEVLDIMNMFTSIDMSLEKIPENEKASVDLSKIKFYGFSGNDETSYFAILNYLIASGRYLAYKDFTNSHFPILDNYRRMLKQYKVLPQSDRIGRSLNKDQIQSLIDAAKI